MYIYRNKYYFFSLSNLKLKYSSVAFEGVSA